MNEHFTHQVATRFSLGHGQLISFVKFQIANVNVKILLKHTVFQYPVM